MCTNHNVIPSYIFNIFLQYIILNLILPISYIKNDIVEKLIPGMHSKDIFSIISLTFLNDI